MNSETAKLPPVSKTNRPRKEYSGTAPAVINIFDPYLPYKAVPEEPVVSNLEKITDVPVPSVPPYIIRGQSLTKWSIDRRRLVREILKQWDTASKQVTTPNFAVYFDALIDKINTQMPQYRDIPYEDAFAGILQLLQEFLENNFSNIQRTAHIDSITNSLSSLLKEEISLSDYKTVLHLLKEAEAKF